MPTARRSAPRAEAAGLRRRQAAVAAASRVRIPTHTSYISASISASRTSYISLSGPCIDSCGCGRLARYYYILYNNNVCRISASRVRTYQGLRRARPRPPAGAAERAPAPQRASACSEKAVDNNDDLKAEATHRSAQIQPSVYPAMNLATHPPIHEDISASGWLSCFRAV